MHHDLRSTRIQPSALTAALGTLLVASAAAQSSGPCLQESIPADVSFQTPGGIIGNGRPLATDGNRILLQVAESHATLFEPVGPSWHAVAEFRPAPGLSGTYNGAVYGNRVAFHTLQGGVDFYERGPGGWTLTQSLQGSAPFSEVLDLDTNFALVLRTTPQIFVQELVVLERTAAGWIEGANLGPYDFRSVALSANRIAFGRLPGAANPNVDIVELFPGGVVQPMQSIAPPLGATDPLFGFRVAMDGNRLVLASGLDGDGNGVLGSVLIYERGFAAPYQFIIRLDDPPQLASIPGVVSFGAWFQMSGNRLLVRFSDATGGPSRTGYVVFEYRPAWWYVNAILDPATVPADSNTTDALLASGNIFLASNQPTGVVRRYAAEVPQGIQVCSGVSQVGTPPSLSIDGCTSASSGRLVVRGLHMNGGALFFGLARGSAALSPGAPLTCIRPAGALGPFVPVGPGVAVAVVDPQVLQSVTSLFGDVLLLQAAERVTPPFGNATLALSAALVIELGE